MSDGKEQPAPPPAVRQAPAPQPIMAFSSMEHFEQAQRMAKALSSSDLIPAMYRGERGIANCLIAMEVAARTGTSILAVVQNLYVIDGRPSWGSSYIIGALNSCGRFTPLNLVMDGKDDDRGCTATAVAKATDERVEGPRVTIKMAKAEGWYGRKGSKWPNMPELMLRYRAAAFFGRLYAPDILMGMQTDEEAGDIGPPIIVDPNEVTVTEVKEAGDTKTEDKAKRRRRTKKEIEAEQQAGDGREAGKEPPEATEGKESATEADKDPGSTEAAPPVQPPSEQPPSGEDVF